MSPPLKREAPAFRHGEDVTKEAMDLKRRGGSGFSEADIRADRRP